MEHVNRLIVALARYGGNSGGGSADASAAVSAHGFIDMNLLVDDAAREN